MSENGKKAEWFLPLVEPMAPDSCRPPHTVEFPSKDNNRMAGYYVAVAGPPVHRDAEVEGEVEG